MGAQGDVGDILGRQQGGRLRQLPVDSRTVSARRGPCTLHPLPRSRNRLPAHPLPPRLIADPAGSRCTARYGSRS
jgi:hypothetical protein